jgi:Tfp pilus assembly protein PilO
MIVNLRDVRTQLLVIVAVLLLFDVAAIVMLVSPAGRSRAQRQQEFEQLRLIKIEKAKAIVPAQGMDQKIATAREEEIAFNTDRLAEHYSTMSEQLAHLANEAGVNVSTVRYDEHEEKGVPPGYEKVGIAIQVHGTYAQDMRFINAVERQKMLLLIDAVSFGGMEGDQLTVSVHLSTFLRSAA